VASRFTDHGGLRSLYVFAYARDGGTQAASFAPSTLALGGAAYVYDVFDETGRLLAPGERFNASVSTGSYFIVAPVGLSGIAFLRDLGELVSLGQKRISQLADDGTVRATVEFARGEQAVTLHGYAPGPPTVVATDGAVDGLTYDASTQRFQFGLRPNTAPVSVTVALSLGVPAP